MVPSDGGLWSRHCGQKVFKLADHVLVGVLESVNSRFGAFAGKGDDVHDDEGVARDLALEKAHDFDVAAGTCMHHLIRKVNKGTKKE